MSTPSQPDISPALDNTPLPSEPPPHSESMPRPRTAHHHEFAEMIQSLCAICIIATFITTFLAQPHRIPSGSMEPTLLIGDFVLVTKNSYTPQSFTPLPHAPVQRGQVIVFLKPGEPDTHLVKRVIGLPGDHIHLNVGRVFINGTRLNEPYALYTAYPVSDFTNDFPLHADQDPEVLPSWFLQLRSLTQNGDLVVPPHMYFVLGDNRNDSLDSRFWGLVPDINIIGTPWLVYFSLRTNTGIPPALSLATPDPDTRRHGHSNSPADPNSTTNSISDRIANFARWDRILHLVQ